MANGKDMTAEELSAAIQEIQRRVRARHPSGEIGSSGILLPDLMPLVHARDAADAKVASIGGVNPRPPGLLNDLVQAAKKSVARALTWFGRGQVDFNRAVTNYLQANIEALSEMRRAMTEMVRFTEEAAQRTAARMDDLAARQENVPDQLAELRKDAADIRLHWSQWRPQWEERLGQSEIRLLRTVSEMQGAFQHRTGILESGFRETVRAQHADYNAALERVAQDVQKRLWADFERVRRDYEQMIHAELRLIRQRAAIPPAAGASPPAPEPPLAVDWLAFGNKFRGDPESIRAQQGMYVQRFAGADDVLDIGCGRGEFLEAAREAGIPARGIDANAEMVAICRARGLEAETADLFEYLSSLPGESLGGLYCSQVIEHLPPQRVPELLRLAHAKLRSGGLIAIETPNPECLAIFATHFYLDPTHSRPVPPALLAFYLQELGFTRIEVTRLHPAVDNAPALASLPAELREQFFGAQDYAAFARKA
ncbi:MAG: methyltransferase domain-containing protein [Bryobacteraceae bacterium]|nr:methyltransferase domain-containing protein [Bryobacteraceae bacterium]